MRRLGKSDWQRSRERKSKLRNSRKQDSVTTLQRWDAAGLSERAGVPFNAARAFLSGLVVTEPERGKIIKTIETALNDARNARKDSAEPCSYVDGFDTEVLRAYLNREATHPVVAKARADQAEAERKRAAGRPHHGPAARATQDADSSISRRSDALFQSGRDGRPALPDTGEGDK